MLNSALLQEDMIYLLRSTKVTMRATHKGDFTLKVLAYSPKYQGRMRELIMKFCKNRLLALQRKNCVSLVRMHTKTNFQPQALKTLVINSPVNV